MKTISKIAFTFLLLTACGSKEEIQSETKTSSSNSIVNVDSEQLKNLGIQFKTISKEQMSSNLNLNGVVEVPPQHKLFITMPFGGFIKKINVLDGMKVKKGQVIIAVEHPEIIQLQQEYLENNAQLELNEQELVRQKFLVEKDASALKVLQQAKANLAITQAKKEGLRIKLEMANVDFNSLNKGKIQRQQEIRAPFDGVITKVNCEVGSFAESKMNLLEIIDLKHVHAELTVFEKHLSSLKEGQKLNLEISGVVGSIKGEIYLIGKELASDRTAKVHCHFDQFDPKIQPGAYIKAQVEINSSDYFVLPIEAVVDVNNKPSIFLTSDGKSFWSEPIQILMSNEKVHAVELSSKQQNSKIVFKGAYELLTLISKNEENE